MLGHFMENPSKDCCLNFYIRLHMKRTGRFLRRGSCGKACLIYDGRRRDGKTETAASGLQDREGATLKSFPRPSRMRAGSPRS
jgi:hypothetical protein